MRIRTIFLLVLGLLLIWFLYIERNILTPFVLAVIFAYIFNPIVNFFSYRMKIPRTLSVLIIFIILMGSVVYLSIITTQRIISDADDLRYFSNNFLHQTQQQIYTLPEWIQKPLNGQLRSIQKSEYLNSAAILGFFPQVFSRILSVLIFLFTSFYFLREGRDFIDKFFLFVPKEYRLDLELLLKKINRVLGGYLRGQLLMVFLVATVLFIALSLLHVRFALILAIFSGFAEIVPLIGPLTATAIAAVVVMVTGSSSFGLQPVQIALIVVAVYTIVRQLQDYLVAPFIMGRVTELHPLIILFAVLSGEHLMGVLGLILAVPVAATIKILLEYSLNLVNEQEHNLKKKS